MKKDILADKRLIIVGASGHGKVIADIAFCCGYRDIVFLDDDGLLKDCMGYPVIGKVEEAKSYKTSHFFVAIGNPQVREKIQKQFAEWKLPVVTLVHPEAVLAETVTVGKGTVIMAGAVINPDSHIGEGCIINTASSVDHDNVLEDYVHVSVGSHIAGTVHVGKRTWIGAGAVVSNDVRICEDCIIGAGAVVVRDIDQPGIYIGVPAKRE